MSPIIRLLTCALLVSSPWWFGGVIGEAQRFFYFALLGLGSLAWIWELLRKDDSSCASPIPLLMWPGLGLMALVLWQLQAPWVTWAAMQHAVWPDLAPTGAPFQVDKELTHLFALQVLGMLAAFWISSVVFGRRDHRKLLWGLLGFNGAALAVFGLVQKITWNEKLFWVVPLRFGGSPFASFVNRNNAGGWLCLSIAAALGGVCLLRNSPIRPLIVDAPKWKIRLGWKDSWAMLMSQFNVGNGSMALIIALTATGIVASLSRGSIVAATVAVTVTAIVLGRRLAGSSWFTGLGIAAVALGVVFWTGQERKLHDRLATLGDPTAVIQGRLEHWSDSIQSLQDFPERGLGMGTYQFAYQPYQAHASDFWYMNADSQYVEFGLEGGWSAIALLGLGFLLPIIVASMVIRRGKEDSIDAAVATLFATIAMAVVSISDFSIVIPSIALTWSMILGALGGRTHFSTSSAWRWVNRLSRLAVGGLLLAAMAWQIPVVQSWVDVEALRNRIPATNRPEDLPLAEATALIDEATELLQKQPQSASLMYDLAQLHMHRSRLKVHDTLQKEIEQMEPRQRPLVNTWSMAEIERYFVVICEADAMKQTETVEAILKLPALAEDLPTALELLRRTVAISPLRRDAHEELARLERMYGDKAAVETNLERALFLSPGRPENLLDLGLVGMLAERPELGERAWKQALQIADSNAAQIWQIMMPRLPTAELEAMYPPRISLWASLARELPKSHIDRPKILKKAIALSKDQPDLPVLDQARLAELGEDFEQAVTLYRSAIPNAPKDVTIRLDLARCYVNLERPAEAMEQVVLSMRLEPNRRDVRMMHEQLSLLINSASH